MAARGNSLWRCSLTSKYSWISDSASAAATEFCGDETALGLDSVTCSLVYRIPLPCASKRTGRRALSFSEARLFPCKDPAQPDRSNQRRDENHHDDGGIGVLRKNRLAFDGQAGADTREDQSHFAARNHADPHRKPLHATADSSETAKQFADDGACDQQPAET